MWTIQYWKKGLRTGRNLPVSFSIVYYILYRRKYTEQNYPNNSKCKSMLVTTPGSCTYSSKWTGEEITNWRFGLTNRFFAPPPPARWRVGRDGVVAGRSACSKNLENRSNSSGIRVQLWYRVLGKIWLAIFFSKCRKCPERRCKIYSLLFRDEYLDPVLSKKNPDSENIAQI